MQLIALTDIFGKTKHFEKIINNLSSLYSSVEILDPYDGEDIDFKDEGEAYNHFQKNMSLETYSKNLLKKLNGKENKKITLLGFSIGASAIWIVSKELKLFCHTNAICFYSSQVRNYLEIDPGIFIEFFFSKTEPNYNVKKAIEKLSKKPKVKCHETEYDHGFMNIKSKNFNQQGYDKYLKIINNA